MAKYVEGFVMVIPKEKSQDYFKMAQEGKESWMRHGALAYYECKGDDLDIPGVDGDTPKSFIELAQAGPDEEVWFSFIIFESKEQREAVNAKVHEEMGEKYAEYTDFVMPFDVNRMAQGGFAVQVEG